MEPDIVRAADQAKQILARQSRSCTDILIWQEVSREGLIGTLR
jgi:hypothetical protein